MREGISIEVTAADRERLAAVVADRNSPQKHVWRAQIILATAEGCGTAEIMRRAGVSKPCVWRWQERFMREGVAGLLRDKTRKPGLPPLPPALVDRVVALTLAEPPHRVVASPIPGLIIGHTACLGHASRGVPGRADQAELETVSGRPSSAYPSDPTSAVSI